MGGSGSGECSALVAVEAGATSGTPGVLGPLPSTVSVLAHQATGSRAVTAPRLCHWCEPLDVLESPDIPGADIPGVTPARPGGPGVPRGSGSAIMMISVLSFNSRDSLGVIRLVGFHGVLILGRSLL